MARKRSYFTLKDKLIMGLIVLGVIAFAMSPLIFGMENVIKFIGYIYGAVFVVFFILVIAVPWAINAIFTDFK